MSATFNGTSSLHFAADPIVGSTPTYPVLMLAWLKPANVTADLAILSVADNASSGVDELHFRLRGNVATDPITAIVTQNGSFSLADIGGGSAGSWITGGALFTSTTSRQGILNGSLGTAQTTSRAPTGITHVSVGALYRASAGSFFWAGQIAEAAIWVGVDAGAVATILSQFQAGLRPPHITAAGATLGFYQPFVAAANEASKVGPTLTEANMAYDDEDHPPIKHLYPRSLVA